MGSTGSGGSAARRNSASRLGAVCGSLVKRPWLSFSRLLLAAGVVGARHRVPQPWSAAAHPITLILALWVFTRAASRN
ncbi:hypothetical protein [Streptomyces glomeratus]|uniref:hypothetical protein n=1 Tax=Streptomyces glomeratus TaxID=284452 RepID=UPI001F2895C3|nr:hypothetical protein [Streptomyces glomeratus]MCF1511225.1 hypothetical protein [Streptomyces glomeratus]